MVEKPYYQAEFGGSGKITHQSFVDAINRLGEQYADYLESKYDYGPDRRAHVEIEVDSWAKGPLLRVERFDSNGEREQASFDKKFTKMALQAGYVPSSFRPEEDHSTGEHTGRWMWYFLPIEDVRDEDSYLFDSAYALQNEDDTFVRADGDLVTFDSEAKAEAVAHEDHTVTVSLTEDELERVVEMVAGGTFFQSASDVATWQKLKEIGTVTEYSEETAGVGF